MGQKKKQVKVSFIPNCFERFRKYLHETSVQISLYKVQSLPKKNKKSTIFSTKSQIYTHTYIYIQGLLNTWTATSHRTENIPDDDFTTD